MEGVDCEGDMIRRRTVEIAAGHRWGTEAEGKRSSLALNMFITLSVQDPTRIYKKTTTKTKTKTGLRMYPCQTSRREKEMHRTGGNGMPLWG